eukprot:Hpha_TRINITY_DN15935_c1_g1::TRINITY_DN15935_c1_g1_i1::g.71531::m.71531
MQCAPWRHVPTAHARSANVIRSTAALRPPASVVAPRIRRASPGTQRLIKSPALSTSPSVSLSPARSPSCGGGGLSPSYVYFKRYFCSAPGDSRPPLNLLVARTNDTVTAAPLTCLCYVGACRYAVILLTCATLPPGLVPTSVALAYAVTRPLSRLRVPLEMGIAVVLTHFWKPLYHLNLSPLVGLPSDEAPLPKDASWFQRNVFRPLASSLRHYGAAYYISSDLVGVVLLLVFADIFSRFGVDLDVLQWFGDSDTAAVVNDAAVAWAVGTVTAAMLSPFILLTLADAIPGVLRVRNGSVRMLRRCRQKLIASS